MAFHFQKKQRVKFLKMLFSYYGIAIALTVLALAVWGEYADPSPLSLLPLACALALIGVAYNTSACVLRRVRLTAFSYSIFASDDQQKVIDRIETIGQYLCLFSAPLLLPFAFFFPAAAKIAVSVSLLILPFVFVFIAGIVADVKYFKHAKKEKQKREAELEEQKKREELGKWK